MPFELSNLNSKLALTLGYLNPALNNSALTPRFSGHISRFVFLLLFSSLFWELMKPSDKPFRQEEHRYSDGELEILSNRSKCLS